MAVTGPSKAKCDAISLKFSFMTYDFLLFPRYNGCTPPKVLKRTQSCNGIA